MFGFVQGSLLPDIRCSRSDSRRIGRATARTVEVSVGLAVGWTAGQAVGLVSCIKGIQVAHLRNSIENQKIWWNSTQCYWFRWILVNSGEVRWSPVKSSEVRCSLVNFVLSCLRAAAGALFPLNIVKHDQQLYYFCFVSFDVGCRRLSPIKHCVNSNNHWHSYFIILLPWIQPHAPFSDWIFCTNK